ncbi:hypothetical protein DFQ28_007494 [Apophysomyces sp. BC1034]|nr:hypothetical protein DFQ30_007419 [Apophysomyces sp. BC1015]KAG0176223.1 hypothetical protein DFQ29_006395 [Apophysomyces sp. BC1021]KAG0186660.1 hypothetical protein DFQ28_007494 [Apophysomyces sp. BC1034]
MKQFSHNNAIPNVILALGAEQRLTAAARRSSCIQTDNSEKTRWACHKTVLAGSSPYFGAMFQSEFRESGATIVFLPRGIFTAAALDGILHYMYTNEIDTHIPGSTAEITTPAALDLLQNIYSAGDYLGMTSLCDAAADRMAGMTHRWNCYCASCVDTVPRLLLFTSAQSQSLDDERMAHMTENALKILTSNLPKTLQSFWTSRELAHLIKYFPETGRSLTQQVLLRINKSNAIESLYACYQAAQTLSQKDAEGTWSKVLNDNLSMIQSRAIQTLAIHFNFYCSQYPTLLSCIDGIKYSFEFLEHILQQTLAEQMDSHNAGIFYQGIVRHLMCRHAVQHCEKVRVILQEAKSSILHFISSRVSEIKESGDFEVLDRGVVSLLAQGK